MELVLIPNSNSSFSIEKPKNPTSKVVFLLPGISGDVFSDKYQSFVDAGLNNSFTVVRIKAWSNIEDVSNKNLSNIKADIDYVINYLQKNYSEIYAVGKSFGGTLLLTLFSKNNNIKKAVLWSPVIGIEVSSNINFYLKESLSSLKTLNDLCVDEVFLKDKDIPILIIHGDADKNIPFSNSEKLVSILPNAQILCIKGADHSFTEIEDREELIKSTFKFFVV